MDARACVELAHSISHHTALHKLVLGYNALGDDGAEALASLLSADTHVRCVRVHACVLYVLCLCVCMCMCMCVLYVHCVCAYGYACVL